MDEKQRLLNEIVRLKESNPGLIISAIYYIAKDLIDNENHLNSLHDINAESNSAISQALIYLHKIAIQEESQSNDNPLKATSALDGLKKHDDGLYSYNV